jgi:hypothetical protein
MLSAVVMIPASDEQVSNAWATDENDGDVKSDCIV